MCIPYFAGDSVSCKKAKNVDRGKDIFQQNDRHSVCELQVITTVKYRRLPL